MSIDNFLDGFIAQDLQTIKETLSCKSSRKRDENAMEFLTLRKGLTGIISHKKTKNCVIIKDIKEFKEFLGNAKTCVIMTQDVRLSDGIYPIEETCVRLTHVNENGKRVYLLTTIGRKDSKGRKSEILLDFSLNPQGIKIKKE